MADDLLKRLKELFAPSIDPKVQQLANKTLQSPAADTLWQISGGGKPITSSNRFDAMVGNLRNFVGGYNPVLDQVSLNPSKPNFSDPDPDANAYDALNVISHEAGHRADFRRSDAPGRNAPFQLPKVDLPPAPPPTPIKGGRMVQISPKELRIEYPQSNDPFARQRKLINNARGKVDPYYQTSPAEGYAQAFATAMEVLRNTPRILQKGTTRDEYANGLAEAEAFTPGTGGIVEALLKEPIFKNHPLQRFYKRK